jgi:NADPH:quinone reductase-like Zn-dependent oxidoreductase
MKAILYTHYGSPDVLQYRDTPIPTPKSNGVLVKILAAAANPLDWHLMRADPFLARLENGLFSPKEPRLGVDFAGIVEAVGSAVREFQKGDEVFGNSFRRGMGAFAEYICIEQTVIVKKPKNISFEQAAAAPLAALTALLGLRDKGMIQHGHKVLINGASGGVGTYAVQIAKSYGAEVTAVSSQKNHALVRSIGADHVIDYTQEDFTRNGQHYDLILCTLGNRYVSEYQRALKPHGKCIISGFTTLGKALNHGIIGKMRSKEGAQTITPSGTVEPNKNDLLFIQELLASGKVVSVIDQCYPLNKTADAIRHLETGRAKGKIIVTVG